MWPNFGELSCVVCSGVLLCVLWCVCVVVVLWRCGVSIQKPCVDSKRARVYVQNFPVCASTTSTCVSTCARFADTHGSVLNVHTEAL